MSPPLTAFGQQPKRRGSSSPGAAARHGGSGGEALVARGAVGRQAGDIRGRAVRRLRPRPPLRPRRDDRLPLDARPRRQRSRVGRAYACRGGLLPALDLRRSRRHQRGARRPRGAGRAGAVPRFGLARLRLSRSFPTFRPTLPTRRRSMRRRAAAHGRHEPGAPISAAARRRCRAECYPDITGRRYPLSADRVAGTRRAAGPGQWLDLHRPADRRRSTAATA